MIYLTFMGGFLLGVAITFIYFAESLAPWIRWKEQVMQKEMALAELRMQGKLNEEGHKRSIYRNEL